MTICKPVRRLVCVRPVALVLLVALLGCGSTAVDGQDDPAEACTPDDRDPCTIDCAIESVPECAEGCEHIVKADGAACLPKDGAVAAGKCYQGTCHPGP